ncbi:MAG: PAS domain S-box protein [Sandaracinaceae bacterium]|nr:PAS domain S-box protein [Sandaracinaceae bacterium]
MSSAGDAGILALFEATPTPGYLTRWDGAEFVLVAINEAARAKTRLPESMIGRPLSPLYANQRETMEAAVQAHREKRRIVRELDVRPQHRAEVSLRLRLTFVPVEPDLLAVFSEDVSSPDRVEGALRDSEARNASIIAATREAVLVLDRQGTILLCNAAAATTFGTPEGAMLGREPEAIGRWALRDGRTELPWREALRTGGDVEAIALAFESERGERRTLRASARPIFDATTAAVTSVACTMTDVTALEATVAALRESESKYRLILESTGEGVWAVGRDGRTRFANGRMASLLGVPLEELERRSVLEVIPAEQAELFRARMDRRLAGVSETFTFVIERPDGTRVHTAATGSPVWEDGRVTGSVAMFRDLTAIRDAEEAARRSEQMLESALAAGKLGVFEFDLDTLEGHWSPHLTDMLGAQRTPGVEAYLELVHADDRARVCSRRRSARRSRRSTPSTGSFLARTRFGGCA